MSAITVPSINNAICSNWTEQDVNLYNTLPFYLVKQQIEYRKRWAIWAKLTGDVSWQPNMGSIMRGVRKEPSPHLRQMAFPNTVDQAPKKDLFQVREVKNEAQVRRHRFESQYMTFLPSFRDFMKDHVARCAQDINEKQVRFNDIFIRGYIFHQSPFVMFPDKIGGQFDAAPMGDGNDAGTSGKSTDYLIDLMGKIGDPGNLSLKAIHLALNYLEQDQRVAPFSGGGQPGDDSTPSDKFCLVMSTEAWNQFIMDPFLLDNRAIDLNIITNGFKGNLFGRVTCKLEDLPIRIAADGTFPAPETIEMNPAAVNFGETVPNPLYTGADFEVAFLVGAEGYDSIKVGPAPKDFSGTGMPDGFGKMFWNGEQEITKNIPIPCQAADGSTFWDTNKYGEYLQIISQATMGIIAKQRRNILPIVFKRKRGLV